MNRRRFFNRLGGVAALGAAASPTPIMGRRSRSSQFSQQWRKLKVIFPRIEGKAWDRYPSAPNIVRAGDKLRMYYMSIEYPSLRRIGFAEADVSDPLTWRKTLDRPVMELGEPGSIDSHWVSYPWVVPVTERHWHMYYATWGGAYADAARRQKVWYTSLAESDDGGLTWKRTGKPLIPLGRPYSYDEHGSGSCAVLERGHEYWMWYTAGSRWPQGESQMSLGLATSTDGGHTFRPHPAGSLISIPVKIGSAFSTCSKPYVEEVKDGYRMWLSVARDDVEVYRIHYAESADGIRWKWTPEPVLDVSAAGWDSQMTCYPFVLHHQDRTYMFYDGNHYSGIGVAELVSS